MQKQQYKKKQITQYKSRKYLTEKKIDNRQNRILKASILKLRSSLPKMLLHLPGVKASLLDGISIQSMIKSEKLTPSGQIMGQKGAECHKGTIRVPDALQLRICNNTRGIRETGGHI